MTMTWTTTTATRALGVDGGDDDDGAADDNGDTIATMSQVDNCSNTRLSAFKSS